MSVCIYVPRMPIAVTDYNVVLIFNNYEIGRVSRVDFTAIGKKPGFVEEPTEPTELNTNFKAAFIHIDEFYSSQLAENVKVSLETGECYKLQVSEKSFWMLLKATTPVKETKMNIHQIVDNCRYLEGIVEAQQKQIEAQQKQIQELMDTTKRVRDEVYQLIGGLYNQTTQSEVIDYHLEMLGVEIQENKKVKGKLTCNIWPTTRQGDELEQRMKKLEEVVYNNPTIKFDTYIENFKNLINSERAENSSTLCGNE